MKPASWKFWLLPMLVLAFIWGNSILSPEQSSAMSDAVKALLARVFPFLEGEDTAVSGSFLVRKAAHLTEYMVLGFCIGTLTLKSGWRYAPFVGCACCLIAADIDETIQIFSGRGSAVRDVWIDFAGALVGVLLAWLLLRRRQNRNASHGKDGQ